MTDTVTTVLQLDVTAKQTLVPKTYIRSHQKTDADQCSLKTYAKSIKSHNVLSN